MQTEITDAYENLYKAYSEGTSEYELLNSITGVGIDQEMNAVVVEIEGLSDEKENTFTTLFGNYSCVEFEEGAPGEDAKTYYPGRGICVITEKTSTKIVRKNISIGYRAYRKTSSGSEYGFATCGHACIDSVDSKVYGSNKSTAKAIGTIYIPTYSGSVDASFVKMIGKRKVGTKTHFDASGNHYGDNIKQNSYMKSVAQGTVIYKCGATTYKTSSAISKTNFSLTTNGVKFTNLTKTDTAFCQHGDSGGIVYTYYKGAYQPCGLIKGHSKKNGYAYYTKASEVVNVLKVYPY